MAVIDIHNHMAPSTVVDFIAREGRQFETEVVEEENGRFFVIEGSARRPIHDRMCTCEARIVDMDRWGVDVQAVSPVPFLMFPEAPAAAMRDLARVANDSLLELPDRFLPVAILPLQAPSDAIAELERVVSLGVRAIEIPPTIGTTMLDSPMLRPFFEAVEELGVLVCIHPFEACPEAPFDRYSLGNLVGNLFDTGLAASLLIYGGVFERHPDLQVMLYHGGGTLAALIDRLDQGYRVSPECRAAIPREPSSYLDQIAVDTVVFSGQWLRTIIDRFGTDRVCMGSDYPLPMGPDDPVAMVRSLGGTDTDAILGGNAARLLRLDRR